MTREDEEELIPLCLEEGLGLMPWSPLARGVLAGSGSGGTLRAATDEQAPVGTAAETRSNAPSLR